MSSRKRKADAPAAATERTGSLSGAHAEPQRLLARVALLGGQERLGGGPLASLLLRERNGSWHSLPLTRERTGATCTTARGRVYLVGGAGRGKAGYRLSSVDALSLPEAADVEHDESPPLTEAVPDMAAPRLFPGAALWGGALWVVGGCNGKRVERSCVRLEVSQAGSGWESGPDLPSVRFANTLSATEGGLLVAAGGLGSSRRTLESVALLATSSDRASWTEGPPLLQARAYAAAVVPSAGPLAGCVVLSGGVGLGSETRAAALGTEAWRPGAAAWALAAPPLLTPRQGHVMWAEADGCLVVAGGRDAAGRFLDSIERLPPGAGAWEEAGRLPRPAFRATAVTLQ